MRFHPGVHRPAPVALCVLLALAVAVPGAASAAGARQSGSIRWTSTRPGSASGLSIDLRFHNPDGASLKPYSVAKLVVRSPAGARVDTTVPPRCEASDAQLIAQGFDGCPRSTRIGSAVVDGDTGSSGPFPRYTRTHVRNYNGDHEIIGVGINDDLPAIRSVDHTRIEGSTSTTSFPIFPGQPPPDPFVAFRRLRIQLDRYVRGGRSYITTPPTCPRSRRWTITATFTYHDGVSQSLRSRSPCRRRGR
jgi:hypothetical protein